jgi:hypothetical protein
MSIRISALSSTIITFTGPPWLLISQAKVQHGRGGL